MGVKYFWDIVRRLDFVPLNWFKFHWEHNVFGDIVRGKDFALMWK